MTSNMFTPVRLVAGRVRQAGRALCSRILFAGVTYKCPLCASHLRRFLPFGKAEPVFDKYQIVGGGYRHNARCPVCGSIDRERLIYLYLVHKTDILTKSQRLLHIAPEKRLASLVSRQTHV